MFPNTSVERHLLAYLIYSFCKGEKKAALAKWRDDDVRYSIVSYGIFHLARVVARRYTGVEAWNDTTQTNNWVTEVQVIGCATASLSSLGYSSKKSN